MAAARAAARREAILNSRGNRLAKLTSSARGDDPGGVYANDDPPLPTIGGTKLENFVGDETALPKPSTSLPPSSKPALSTSSSDTQMPDWGSAQQQDFIRALMGGMPGQQSSDSQPLLNDNKGSDASPSAPEDPISTLLAALGGNAGGPFTPDPPPAPRPRTFVQKLIPVLHVLGMLAILVWFVGWREPEAFAESWRIHSDKPEESKPEASSSGIRQIHEGWIRWAMLSHGPAGGVVIPPIPAFFWAFITLQITLHSLRLVSQPNAYRPPMLLGLVMPYLPPSLRQAILTSLKYLQMGSMVLDDLAILVFGIGLVVFVSSNWMT